ncbi:MAG: hypothetical protein HYV27_11010 [Candidatus Hydrogenedentes bacterium]|nr:hypothetical protein [Candidatus Hydrogenedentota bacterium]
MNRKSVLTLLGFAASGVLAITGLGGGLATAQNSPGVQPAPIVEPVAPAPVPTAAEVPADAGDPGLALAQDQRPPRRGRGDRNDGFGPPPPPPGPPAFEEIDANSDGSITKEEFTQFAEKRRAEFPGGPGRGYGPGPRRGGPEGGFGQDGPRGEFGPGPRGRGPGDCPCAEEGFGPRGGGEYGYGPHDGRHPGPRGGEGFGRGPEGDGPRGGEFGRGPGPQGGHRGPRGGDEWGGPQGGEPRGPREDAPPPPPPGDYNY